MRCDLDTESMLSCAGRQRMAKHPFRHHTGICASVKSGQGPKHQDRKAAKQPGTACAATRLHLSTRCQSLLERASAEVSTGISAPVTGNAAMKEPVQLDGCGCSLRSTAASSCFTEVFARESPCADKEQPRQPCRIAAVQGLSTEAGKDCTEGTPYTGPSPCFLHTA